MKLKSRPVQTRVKHQILERYIKAWGNIILSGLASRGITDAHFCYIDCNAYTGRYNGELEEEKSGKPRSVVYGSPIIGLKALDDLGKDAQGKGIYLRTNAILCEIDPANFEELKNTLDLEGFAPRVFETSDFNNLRSFQIAICNNNSIDLVQKIIDFTQAQFKYSLYLLDPWGPQGIPLKGYVDNIIKQDRHDVIINMPYQDLHKKTGFVIKPDLTPNQQNRILSYDRMFGNKKWQDIVLNLQKESPEDKTAHLELQLMENYQDSLQNVDSELIVNSIGLRFSEQERTMFYLYLTTHDPTGALTICEILNSSHYKEHELRYRLRDVKMTGPDQLSFLEMVPIPELEVQSRLETDYIADQICKKLSGKTLKLRDLYREFANEHFFIGEILKALRQLKKDGKADFDNSLKNSTDVTIF